MPPRYKNIIKHVIIPIIIIYILCHIIYSTYRLYHVDDTRISFSNVKDGPLLLKSGKNIKKKGNIIEAIGYGKLGSFDHNKKRPKIVKPKFNNIVPKLTSSAKTKVLKTAKNILEKYQNRTFVYFTMINKAYERMTLNWICNTAMMETVHPRTLIIAMEASTCSNIHSQWEDTITCIDIGIDNYDSGYDWGNQQYINLLTLRANIMLELVNADIPFILFETDAVWFKDPIALFKNQTEEWNYEDVDIVVPIKGYDGGKSDKLAFDPMMVLPTNGSKLFFGDMVEKLRKDKKAYDQDIMNDMCSSQHNGLICRQFDYSDIADGKWFKMDPTERTIPYIVNNNFNTGSKNKETRQSLNGFWFLAIRSNQCVISKINHFMTKYGHGLL